MFICSTLLSQTYLFEQEFEALDGLLRVCRNKQCIFLSKVLSSQIFIWLVHCLCCLLLGLFLEEQIFGHIFSIGMLSFLAVFGIVSIGTLLACLSSLVSARELMLPIVLFPFSLPLIAGSVFLTQKLMTTGDLAYKDFWFVCICVFDVVAFSAGWVLFEYAIEE